MLVRILQTPLEFLTWLSSVGRSTSLKNVAHRYFINNKGSRRRKVLFAGYESSETVGRFHNLIRLEI